MGQSWSQNQNARALRQLAPQTAPQGTPAPPLPLNRQTLTNALNFVASEISHRKHHITIVSVGGVVNTMFLQSRVATHDIDFFSDRLKSGDYKLLLKATSKAMKHDKRLRDEWMKNRDGFVYAGESQEDTYRRSLQTK